MAVCAYTQGDLPPFFPPIEAGGGENIASRVEHCSIRDELLSLAAWDEDERLSKGLLTFSQWRKLHLPRGPMQILIMLRFYSWHSTRE